MGFTAYDDFHEGKTLIYTKDDVIKLDVDIDNIPDKYKELPAVQMKFKDNIPKDIKSRNLNGWAIEYEDNKFFIVDPFGEKASVSAYGNLWHTARRKDLGEMREDIKEYYRHLALRTMADFMLG
jgi:hypothetical protein